ncbi:hypothetical protein FPRO06_00107 [Fusarium proliferatum]|nr:hypothetical protein FPRO06_00107 [Fusarium proliferatum]
MPEASFPDYRLSGRALQAWLRLRFEDDTITVERYSKRHVVYPISPARRVAFAASNGLPGYSEQVVKSPTDLRKHLQQNRKDPQCCMVFIESNSARDRLNCSRESYSLLSSFYQVGASFVDFLSSFGVCEEPLDYHMTGFNSHDTLDAPEDKITKIPELGRSGREHAVQYLLRSVEKSTKSTKDGEQVIWNIRQMAVHHKFDFGQGKTFWLNIKTNSVMQERMKTAMGEGTSLSSAAAKNLPASFAATLLTHLIHLEWCDESWRKCINHFEKEIQKVLKRARTARIDKEPNLRSKALKRIFTNRTEAAAAESSSSLARWARKPLFSCFAPTSEKGTCSSAVRHVALNREGPPANEEGTGLGKQLESLMVLETFSFEEVQHLHFLADKLESFRLVMQLNRQVLRDIIEHYEDLPSRTNFPDEIKISCKDALTSFSRRVERIRKNLEIRVAQNPHPPSPADHFSQSVRWHLTVSQCAGQPHLYRELAHAIGEDGADRLQDGEGDDLDACYHLRHIGVSAWNICSLTRAKAFFQSGLVEINQAATDVRGAVTFHPGAFKLFAAICFPLMCITFILWMFLFKILSGRALKRSKEESLGSV